jgi:sarcosine oxidase delta subunit
MTTIEKVGVSKDIWVMCPGCEDLFYIHRSFYDPAYDQIKLHCPFCHKEFAKEEAAKTWGAD